tara:strand:- start:10927 stop:11658 length:732 start_codon:yes stop_codon:yes gene_type:complete
MGVEFFKDKIHFDELESTNIYCKRVLDNSMIKPPFIVTSDFQKNGKGQFDSSWISERRKNLLISLVINSDIKPMNSFLLNIISSLSIIDLLNYLSVLNTYIKWPNDILVKNKKIAGILIENKVKSNQIIYSIIGIGLNVNQKNFPDFNRKATSISNEIDKEINLEEIRDLLTNFFRKRIIMNPQDNYLEYTSKIYLKDKESIFEINKEKVYGRIKSVNDIGLLEVIHNGIIKNYDLKEIKYLV